LLIWEGEFLAGKLNYYDMSKSKSIDEFKINRTSPSTPTHK
jgi:hypothetical protein